MRSGRLQRLARRAGRQRGQDHLEQRPRRADRFLSTAEHVEALRSYVKDFGAWEEEEIASWDDAECNALFVQLASGDLREAAGVAPSSENEEGIDWEAYEELAEKRTCSGNIYKGGDDRIYYSLCH